MTLEEIEKIEQQIENLLLEARALVYTLASHLINEVEKEKK